MPTSCLQFTFFSETLGDTKQEAKRHLQRLEFLHPAQWYSEQCETCIGTSKLRRARRDLLSPEVTLEHTTYKDLVSKWLPRKNARFKVRQHFGQVDSHDLQQQRPRRTRGGAGRQECPAGAAATAVRSTYAWWLTTTWRRTPPRTLLRGKSNFVFTNDTTGVPKPVLKTS